MSAREVQCFDKAGLERVLDFKMDCVIVEDDQSFANYNCCVNRLEQVPPCKKLA